MRLLNNDHPYLFLIPSPAEFFLYFFLILIHFYFYFKNRLAFFNPYFLNLLQANALLKKNLENAKASLEVLVADLHFLRDQQTITQVKSL